MIKKVIAAAFKSKGKRKMKKSELIYTMSFDLNWFSHETSKKVVKKAEKNGLIEGDDEVKPTFDLEEVSIPSDFKPDAKRTLADSPVEVLIEEISEKTGKSYQEVISLINRKQEKVANLLSFEVVVLLLAKEVGIDIKKYIDKIEESIFK